MIDPIDRQAAIDEVRKAYENDEMLDGYEYRLGELPSAQPEIKPIDYQDCANAMLRMWMDKVVTDGEYNRIMDKLNAFWGTRNEQHD